MFRGDRLKKLRTEKSLTQKEVSEVIGVSKSSICYYEKNKRTPSIENIIDFIHLFGVSADYLIGTDKIVKTVEDSELEYKTFTKEELDFIEELKKDKFIYNMILEDAKRCAELVKRKIG